MRLLKSVPALRQKFDELTSDSAIKCKLTVHANNLKARPIDWVNQLRFDLWAAMGETNQKEILSHSGETLESVNDAHIKCMLVKAFDIRLIISIETGIILSKYNLFNIN